MNTGILYRKLYPDSAINKKQKALDLRPEKANQMGYIILQFNLANIYVDRKEFAMAKQIYDKVLEYCVKENIQTGIARVYDALATLNRQLGQFDKAADYLEEARNTALKNGENSLYLKYTTNLAYVYQNSGNYEKAFKLIESAKLTSDTIAKSNMEDIIAEINHLNQLTKIEQENQMLKSHLMDKELKLKSSVIMIFLLLIALIAIVILYFRIRKLSKNRLHSYSLLINEYQKKDFSTGNTEINGNHDQLKGENNDLEKLLMKLIHYYESEKPYLNPKLKLEHVVEKLNVTRRALGAALKQFKHSNFNNFTNYYRVEEAKKMMESDDFKNYKIEAIAAEAGFGTKMSFYNSFEHFTGIKPSLYRSFIADKELNRDVSGNSLVE